MLVFFTTYVVCEIPSNMLLNRLRPSLYLPTLAILWGIAAACQGAVTEWKQLVALRMLVGVFESGFAPGCAFYLSSWYKRYELASRYAWLYTSVAVAGALSGLLAGVITEYMDDALGIRGWRWLFILEGLGSVVIGILVIFVMPDYPTSKNSKFLTEDERLLACNRLAMDGMGLTQAAHEKVSEWTALKMTVQDWRTWLLCFLFMLGTGAQTMQYFVPSLVETFGWEGHKGQCKALSHNVSPSNYLLYWLISIGRYDDSQLRVRRRLHFGRLFYSRQTADNLARIDGHVGDRICALCRNHGSDQWYGSLRVGDIRLWGHLWVLALDKNVDLTRLVSSRRKASGRYRFD